ncbi:MAG: anthranilate phosphoribosyltransferase [Chloroflexi bacterium]|nr:anthranilate phosphoribosyltransferase [Chloroflexota bacterium]
MIKETIAKVMERQHLSETEAEAVMQEIMHGEATPVQIAAFLVALRMKGETIEEIIGCARAMRANAIPVRVNREVLVDTCGTGGDGSGTFNVSTIAAFVVAGAGLAVAKHGNRAVSSHCGSADLFQALGIRLEITPDQVARCIDEVGIGFLFAPLHHPAMKHAIGPRREIGARTIFNILGPLTNPASANVQVLGVYSPALAEPLANVLRGLGTRCAFVVHGADGLDELSTTGVNQVVALRDGSVKTYPLDPQELGLPKSNLAELRGGDVSENVRIAYHVLRGEPGPARDIVLLNAAAALVAGGKASALQEGLEVAAESIDTGRALRTLEKLISLTQDFAPKESA